MKTKNSKKNKSATRNTLPHLSKGRKGAKTTTTHPRTGKEMNIDAGTHQRFKAAIIQSLAGHREKTFTELTDDVRKIIKKTWPGFKGSIPWYTISVRLDLETRGIVETFAEKGKKFNRLR